MSKKKLVEIETDKDTGEEHVKINATPEEVAKAIFAAGNVDRKSPSKLKSKDKPKGRD